MCIVIFNIFREYFRADSHERDVINGFRSCLFVFSLFPPFRFKLNELFIRFVVLFFRTLCVNNQYGIDDGINIESINCFGFEAANVAYGLNFV